MIIKIIIGLGMIVGFLVLFCYVIDRLIKSLYTYEEEKEETKEKEGLVKKVSILVLILIYGLYICTKDKYFPERKQKREDSLRNLFLPPLYLISWMIGISRLI